MRIENRIFLLTATAIAAMFVTQAGAQYRAVGNDGIAASPKLRQVLNQRARPTAKPQAATLACCCQPSADKPTVASTKTSGQCCERTPEQPRPAPIKE
jgi:hypothetical protein